MKYFILGLIVAQTISAATLNLVGHRGASTYAPENSLLAILLAYEQGALAAECDIQLTKDGKIVLLHDESLLRTAGVDRLIVDVTYEQIKDLDLSCEQKLCKNAVGIPLLSNVVERIPKDKFLFVEIKAGDLNQGISDAFINALIDFIERTPKQTLDKLVFISFNHEVLRRLKFLFHDLSCMPLLAFRQSDGSWPYVLTEEDIQEYVGMAQRNGFLGLFLEYGDYLTKEIVVNLQTQGLMVAVWNYQVDDTLYTAKTMASYGVDFYNTNDVPKIVQALKI